MPGVPIAALLGGLSAAAGLGSTIASATKTDKKSDKADKQRDSIFNQNASEAGPAVSSYGNDALGSPSVSTGTTPGAGGISAFGPKPMGASMGQNLSPMGKSIFNRGTM